MIEFIKDLGVKTIESSTGSTYRKSMCTLRCGCGHEWETKTADYKAGKVLRCKRCAIVKRNTTHGKTKTKLHKAWTGMKERCLNKNSEAYHSYGGRGIKISDEWLLDFMNFHNWAIENGFRNDLSIERIDVNGNYNEGNCTWIPMSEQSKNRRPYNEWKKR